MIFPWMLTMKIWVFFTKQISNQARIDSYMTYTLYCYKSNRFFVLSLLQSFFHFTIRLNPYINIRRLDYVIYRHNIGFNEKALNFPFLADILFLCFINYRKNKRLMNCFVIFKKKILIFQILWLNTKLFTFHLKFSINLLNCTKSIYRTRFSKQLLKSKINSSLKRNWFM